MLPEPPRGGFHPDKGIIFAVLQGVDRIVADHPKDRTGPEHESRAAETTSNGRPADQRPPGEDEAKPHLRPPGDALHDRIGRDQRPAPQHHQSGRQAKLAPAGQPNKTHPPQPCPASLTPTAVARQPPNPRPHHPPPPTPT